MQKYIKRLLIGFTALLVAGGSLSLGIFTDEAQAATYSVSNGPLFNDPYGSKSKRMAILNQINGNMLLIRHYLKIYMYKV